MILTGSQKSLKNRKYTFLSDSIRVQWIRRTPSGRLSTPSSKMSEIFLFVSNGMVELYTTTLPVFRWKAKGYDWILVDSIGQPSLLQGQHNCNELAYVYTNLLTLPITWIQTRQPELWLPRSDWHLDLLRIPIPRQLCSLEYDKIL